MATPAVVRSHPHLSHLAHHFPEFDKDASVLLLIGRDSGPSMITRCDSDRAPVAHHTSLGWSLVGECGPGDCKSYTALRTSTLEHFDKEYVFTPKSRDFSSNIFQEYPEDELPGLSQNERKFLDLFRQALPIMMTVALSFLCQSRKTT